MAPEVRDGSVGDQASDVYTVGAILYYAVTGIEPPLIPAECKPPRTLRPNTPAALERILMRALRPAPGDRYLTASEMLEDFASDAGTFDNPALMVPPIRSTVAGAEDGTLWEKKLRRALGDDYELLQPIGAGGFGRVYRVRDLHLEREVALKVLHPHFTALPAGGAAGRAAQPSEHRRHLRHRRTVGAPLVHHGVRGWAEPGAEGRERRPDAGRG